MKRFKTIIRVIVFFSIYTMQGQSNDNPVPPIPSFDSTTNCQLRYFYYPNLQSYYDSQKKIFFLRQNGSWRIAEEIPEGFGGYSIYNKTNIIINDYDDDLIIQFLPKHKKEYPYVTHEKIRKQLAEND